jgi:hypothetical protein
MPDIPAQYFSDPRMPAGPKLLACLMWSAAEANTSRTAPRCLFRAPMTDAARVTGVLLWSLVEDPADPSPVVRLSRRELARRRGVTLLRVASHLAQLRSLGFIETVEGGWQLLNPAPEEGHIQPGDAGEPVLIDEEVGHEA